MSARSAIPPGGLVHAAKAAGAYLYVGEVDEDGAIRRLESSDGLEALLGRTLDDDDPDEVYDGSVHPDDLALYQAAFRPERLRALGAVDVTYRLVRGDGHAVWVRERARVEADGDRCYVYGAVIDVTDDRRRYDLALHARDAAEQSLLLLQEASSDVGEHLYVDELQPDGTWRSVFASALIERFLGRTIGGAGVADAWSDAVHPLDRLRYEAAASRTRAGADGASDLEYRLVRADGVVRWVRDRWVVRSVGGGRRTCVGLAVDITEERTALERLRIALEEAEEARSTISRIVDSIDQHLYTLEYAPDGPPRVVFASPGLERLLGAPLRGSDPRAAISERVHPADRARFEASFSYWSVRIGEPIVCTYRIVGEDGTTRSVNERCVPRLAADGRILADGVISDVTAELQTWERMREERAAADSARKAAEDARVQLQHTAEATDTFIYTVHIDPDGAWRTVDDCDWSRLIGADSLPDGPVARDALWTASIHPDDGELVANAASRLSIGADVAYGLRVVGVDGATRSVFVRERTREILPDGTVVASGVMIDVTEHQELKAQLARANATDMLTGVASRGAFLKTLAGEMQAEEDGDVGLILIDIDGFKKHNDRHGHAAGDTLIREVARRVDAAAGDERTLVARFGGEEFAVILSPAPDEAGLRRRAEDLSAAVCAAPVVLPGGEALEVTVSVGAAAGSRREALAYEDLLRDAERALATAKHAGRSRVALLADARAQELPLLDARVLATAEALADAAGMKEGVPRRHCRDVARLAGRIAEAAGAPVEVVARAFLGGLLHDVGKLAVRDELLRKAGPLTDEEWVEMRAHTEIGDGFVRAAPGLDDAANAVRHHHERWDGTGYPDGLAGTAIPYEARVLCIADAVVAMSETRSYRRRSTAEAVRAEILRCAGSHFDPNLVETAVRVLDEQAGPTVAAAD